METIIRFADRWQRLFASDVFYSFRHSPVTVIAALVATGMIVAAFMAPWIAPQNTFDLASLNLLYAELPPAWQEGGDPAFLLGTDTQGRDILSGILYGSQVSIIVGVCAVLLAMTLGVSLGLISGYFGGIIDGAIMRVADLILSFPTILVALLINGVARGLLPDGMRDQAAMLVIIVSIGLTEWVQYARTVRGATMVEKAKEYTQAARVLGLGAGGIMFRHVLPNVLSPVLVIATLNLALAILIEATLSFLGVGMPPTQPSLGTLIRIGNEYLFSGLWWIVIFPSLTLVVLVLSVNLLGDWLRDALNPKLR